MKALERLEKRKYDEQEQALAMLQRPVKGSELL